jgi:hypothetical protein
MQLTVTDYISVGRMLTFTWTLLAQEQE